MNPTRRQFSAATGAALLLPPFSAMLNAAKPDGSLGSAIATNTYPWLTFARREERRFELHTDELLAQIAKTGITGYEPIIEDVSEFKGLAERLKRHQLVMHSIYVNVLLHEEESAEQNIEDVVSIARAAAKHGTQIVVANPTPIRWGGTEDKDDRQLRLQGKMLNRLGARLKTRRITLAYHNHDAELRQGGREFHHMLTATDPENVKFCFDAHWVFRGCGNSEVAVFDALAHYHDRIVELHLRQSKSGVWTEAFSLNGDIDYRRVLDFLAAKGNKPHLVLEQAVEAESPHELSVVDAHRVSYEHLSKALSS